MEAGNLEEESGFLSGGFLNRSWLTGRQSRERAAHNNRSEHSRACGLTWNCLMAGLRHLLAAMTCTFMIWMEWARARWRAPISRSDREKTCESLAGGVSIADWWKIHQNTSGLFWQIETGCEAKWRDWDQTRHWKMLLISYKWSSPVQILDPHQAPHVFMCSVGPTRDLKIRPELMFTAIYTFKTHFSACLFCLNLFCVWDKAHKVEVYSLWPAGLDGSCVYSQHWVTAPEVVRSLYSLYMLWVPLRES